MDKKKILFILIGVLLAVNLVSAAVDYIPQNFKNVLKELFLNLPDTMRSTNDMAIVYMKLILWILVFAILFSGVTRLPQFEKKKNIAVTIAAILAFMTVLLIPKEIMSYLFINYSDIIAVLLGLAPIFVGLYIWNKLDKENPVRCVILLLISIVAFTAGAFFLGAGENASQEYEKYFYEQSGQWTILGAGLAMIMGILCFVGKIRAGGGGGPTPAGPTPAGPTPPGPTPPGPTPPGPTPPGPTPPGPTPPGPTPPGPTPPGPTPPGPTPPGPTPPGPTPPGPTPPGPTPPGPTPPGPTPPGPTPPGPTPPGPTPPGPTPPGPTPPGPTPPGPTPNWFPEIVKEKVDLPNKRLVGIIKESEQPSNPQPQAQAQAPPQENIPPNPVTQNKYLWYVCYSGFLMPRNNFLATIQKLRDKSAPSDIKATQLRFSLYFGGNRGRGIGLIDPRKQGVTHGMMYKITKEQFVELLCIQNGFKETPDLIATITHSLNISPLTQQPVPFHLHTTDKDRSFLHNFIIYLGEAGGIPVITTTSWDLVIEVRPDLEHLKYTVEGLKEIGIPPKEIFTYLKKVTILLSDDEIKRLIGVEI